MVHLACVGGLLVHFSNRHQCLGDLALSWSVVFSGSIFQLIVEFGHRSVGDISLGWSLISRWVSLGKVIGVLLIHLSGNHWGLRFLCFDW